MLFRSTYYVDGSLLTTRTFENSSTKVALITEDAEARFANISLVVDGETKQLELVIKDCLVDINGKTLYSTVHKEGIWHRIKPKFVVVM